MMVYPWLHEQWQALVDREQQGRLAHGIILHGLDGLGKQQLAVQFAKFLLCESPQQDQPCGECKSCHQFEARTHPDFILLEPEEAGKSIKVQQIRELVNRFELASHYTRYRVAVINPADAMNMSASNSLLKTLEEPPEGTLIILVTSQLNALLPTIRSRCQHILIHKPEYRIAMDWLINNHTEKEENCHAALALTSGAPVAALGVLESEEMVLRDEAFAAFYAIGTGQQSALPLAGAWLKAMLPQPIQWLYSWAGDLARLKTAADAEIANRDKRENLHKLAQQVELNRIFTFLDLLTSLLRVQRIPLNPQMTLEHILVQWQTLTSDQRR